MINFTSSELLGSFFPFLLLGMFFSLVKTVPIYILSKLKHFFLFVIKKIVRRKNFNLEKRLNKPKFKKLYKIGRTIFNCFLILSYGLVYSAFSYFYLDGVVRLLPFFFMLVGLFLPKRIIECICAMKFRKDNGS